MVSLFSVRRPPKGVLPPVGGTGAARRVGKKPPLLDSHSNRTISFFSLFMIFFSSLEI